MSVPIRITITDQTCSTPVEERRNFRIVIGGRYSAGNSGNAFQRGVNNLVYPQPRCRIGYIGLAVVAIGYGC